MVIISIFLIHEIIKLKYITIKAIKFKNMAKQEKDPMNFYTLKVYT